MYCINCGSTVKDGELMCTICGEPMQKSDFSPLSYDDFGSSKKTMINGQVVGEEKKKKSIFGPKKKTVSTIEYSPKMNNNGNINSAIGHGKWDFLIAIAFPRYMAMSRMDPKTYIKYRIIGGIITLILVLILAFFIMKYVNGVAVENADMQELMEIINE